MRKNTNPQRAEYMKHVERQKSSGLSIKKYCEQNNLAEHKLSYYRSYKTKHGPAKPASPAFASVQITQPAAKHLSVVAPKIDPVWLAKLIHNLLV